MEATLPETLLSGGVFHGKAYLWIGLMLCGLHSPVLHVSGSGWSAVSSLNKSGPCADLLMYVIILTHNGIHVAGLWHHLACYFFQHEDESPNRTRHEWTVQVNLPV